MAAKAANLGPALMRFVEKSLLLQTLDAVWKEHLLALDHLRQGIGLRAYGQRDPLNEYKSEAFALFNAMLDELKERVTSMLARVELGPEAPPEPLFQPCRPARCCPTRTRPAPRPTPAATCSEAERPGRDRPRRPLDLEGHAPQRPMPLRLRQEIQALPRAGLTAEAE